VRYNDYTRQRRDNLMRMHHFVSHPDDGADEALLETAQSLKSFYYMKDLFPHAPVSQPRAFAACHRLVAQGALHANLDHVLWENSRLQLAPNLNTTPARPPQVDARARGSACQQLPKQQVIGRAA
jgi:hypothetical protein